MGAGLLFSVRLSSGGQVGAGPPLRLSSLRDGLCTDLPQWIQAPAPLGSPCLQLPLSFYLLGGGGPELWGHPTPLSTRQRDSLTDPRHLWAEGLVWPLEIPSLKPARVCFSWCRGRSRSGLGWAPRLQRDRPFARGLQVPLEHKSPSLHCSVASLLQNSP